MGRMTRGWVVVVAGLLVVACSSGSQNGSSSVPGTTAPATVTPAASTPAVTTPVATTAPVTTAPDTAVPPTTAASFADASWATVEPPADCQCADGSAYSLFVRKADPTKVVFFLQGGGACWNAFTCAFQGGTYKVTTGAFDDPANAGGIFDVTDPRNPFADYSMVFVPYCTGDVHLGDATTTYGPGLTVHHNGAVNARAGVDLLVADFPDAAKVVVVGESAGSVASPFYGALLADALPSAGVTVFADSSGAYPDTPEFASVYGLWGAEKIVPDWPESAAIRADGVSNAELFVIASRHDPRIVFARHDYATDAVQTTFIKLLGDKVDSLIGMINANEAFIEGDGVDLHSYTAPGSGHTVFSQAGFYSESVNGVKLVDWVTELVNGTNATDVRCDTCG